jgi:arylsulfatase A-like enzyme
MSISVDRRTFLQSALAAAGLGMTAQAAFAQRPAKPNIIFILADDLGYGDLSCYGRPDYQTPVLDELARQGIKFTDAYATPVCTPTRVAFHTGRYPHRLPVGLQEPLGDRDLTLGIPEGHPTVASVVKKAGYATTLIGKWNLGNVEKYGPNSHGYDEFYGIRASQADYYTHKNAAGTYDLWENLEPSKDEGYLTDLFTERAVKVIQRKHDKPFFISLFYNAPHTPLEPPDQKPGDKAGSPKEIYTAMVKSMDTGIGKVLQALKDANLERNTLVIFGSDNGGTGNSYLAPFSGQKGQLAEGGLRVPMIVRWPGVVPAGKTTDQVAFTFDISATIVAAAGGKAETRYALDGVDLMDVCAGKRAAFEHTVFFRSAQRGAPTGQGAVRSGKYKYFVAGTTEHLYDLSVDPGEKNDIKDTHADVLAKLRAQYKKWDAQMLPNPPYLGADEGGGMGGGMDAGMEGGMGGGAPAGA